jgi:hypothetical protein
VTRVLFVEGKDPAALRALAGRLPGPWRLLSRPEQGLFLLEAELAAGDDGGLERTAASLEGARAWSFDVLDTRPSD